MPLFTPLRRWRPELHTRTLNTPPVDTRTLPDPTITPADRAWATLWYLEAHPDEWRQDTFGRFLPDGSTVGCFAHHLVRQAGYTEFGCKHKVNGAPCQTRCSCCLPARPLTCVGAGYVKTEIGWEGVPSAATRLLGVCGTGGLYSGGNTLAGIRAILTDLVGPEPAQRG